MSVDWITVAAQLANFLVLVWLLKRFLYRPILDGIDARETEITRRMQEAEREKGAAAAVKADFEQKLATVAAERETMTEAARRDAEHERDELLAETHARLERERAAWQAHLDHEARSFADRMHRAGGRALLAVTRKALSDLADETLEPRIAAHLARRMAPMDAELARATGRTDEAVVTTRAALPQDVCDELTAELRGLFPAIDLRFETDGAQAPGLVLDLGGAQLAWTVETYLDDLESLLAEQLAHGSEPLGRADVR